LSHIYTFLAVLVEKEMGLMGFEPTTPWFLSDITKVSYNIYLTFQLALYARGDNLLSAPVKSQVLYQTAHNPLIFAKPLFFGVYNSKKPKVS